MMPNPDVYNVRRTLLYASQILTHYIGLPNHCQESRRSICISYQPKNPRCSSRILTPMSIRITPPASSALDYISSQIYYQPLPRPPTGQMSVQPIKVTAQTIFTWRNAKVTPTARASILVATASAAWSQYQARADLFRFVLSGFFDHADSDK